MGVSVNGTHCLTQKVLKTGSLPQLRKAHCLTQKVLETGSLPQLRKVLETGGEATVSLDEAARRLNGPGFTGGWIT
jgi:hypothetical protein